MNAAKYFSEQKKKKLPKRERLLLEVMETAHQLARLVVSLREVIAKIAGAPTTDILCMEYLAEKGEATAGELAKATGLTTGGITGAITRMEKAGWVSYERDPNDKRKVIVKPIQKNISWLHTYLHPIFLKVDKLYQRIPTASLEQMVKSHMEVVALYEEEIAKLADEAEKIKKD